MDPADLRALLDELRGLGNDTARIEAKETRGGLPGKLWKTISAFANSGGGVLLFGVDEVNDFAPVGVTDAAPIEMSLASMLSDRMDPPVRAVIETQVLDGRSIVVAEIPALPRALQPCFYRGEGPYRGSYVRVADGDRRLSEYEVGLILAGRGQPREDERPVDQADPEDLSGQLVDAYIARLRQRRPRAFGDMAQQDVLRQTKVLVRAADGRVVPSLAGLLSLGTFPQTHLTQVDLSLVVYPTAESGQPGPRGERFLDNVTFDGPIPDIVEDVLERLRLRMSRRSVVAGAGRRDVWEYPELALREAVANALVHRDLSPGALGAQVQLEMYPDRLVVRSPGGLYGPVEIDRLGQGGVSSARNALLLKLLEDVPNRTGGTVVENRGSGIPAMVQALRAAGMAGPTFRDEISFFEVVFPNAALLDDETVRWLTDLGVTGLTDSQLLALARMRRGEVLRNASYRSELGVDSRRATGELRDLVDRGLSAWKELAAAPPINCPLRSRPAPRSSASRSTMLCGLPSTNRGRAGSCKNSLACRNTPSSTGCASCARTVWWSRRVLPGRRTAAGGVPAGARPVSDLHVKGLFACGLTTDLPRCLRAVIRGDRGRGTGHLDPVFCTGGRARPSATRPWTRVSRGA